MKPNTELTPEFVELVPPVLKDGVIYISMIYGSAIHKCCCGCGEKVVTPFGPTDWQLIFDGSVSLKPSIGNWNFACKSHYFIRNNKVLWAQQWSQEQIDAGRAHDRLMKEIYFETSNSTVDKEKADGHRSKQGFWRKLMSWFS